MKRPATNEEIDFKIVVGAKLGALRKQHGATQEQIGDMIEHSPASIGNIERGAQSLTAHNLYRLARHFGVSADALLPGTPVPDETTQEPEALRRQRRLETLLGRAVYLRDHLSRVIEELEGMGQARDASASESG